jgi:hypothetical protein
MVLPPSPNLEQTIFSMLILRQLRIKSKAARQHHAGQGQLSFQAYIPRRSLFITTSPITPQNHVTLIHLLGSKVNGIDAKDASMRYEL